MNRNSSDSPMVNAITTTATNNWSSGIVSRPSFTWVVLCTIGSGGACCGVVLYRRMMVAWRKTKMPTDATTLASGGAWRRGRKIRKCRMSPSSTQNASETPSAGQKPRLVPERDRDREVRRAEGRMLLELMDDAFDGLQRVREWRQEQLTAVAQDRVDVRDVHRDRAVGEVDDARAAVREHDSERDRRDQRAECEAGAREEVLPVFGCARTNTSSATPRAATAQRAIAVTERSITEPPSSRVDRLPDDDRFVVVTVGDADPLSVLVLLDAHLDPAHRDVGRHVALQRADLQHHRAREAADLGVEGLHGRLPRRAR